MRMRLFFGVLPILLSTGVLAQEASSLIEPLVEEMTAVRRDFHQHPELSNRELRTSGIVAEQLRGFGYELRTGLAHTGVTAVLDSGRPGPRLAIRADMDGLPVTEAVELPFASQATGEYLGKTVGVMHACGHDAHMAMTLAVARVLAEQRAHWAGEVMFIFQPAEEGAPPGEEGGAPLMVKDGVFDDFRPDAIFGMHVVSALPAGVVAVREGGAMASSDTFRVLVRGRQAHGATPWQGVDPITTAAEIVLAAQTIVSRKLDINKEPAVLTFGIFDGGSRFNIVPEQVELQGTIRAFDEDMRQQALAGLQRIVQHVAAAHGAEVESWIPLSEDSSNPVNYNDPALTKRVRASLEKALGSASVQTANRWTASEDFPHFSRALDIPGVYFMVGATPEGQDPATAPSNHSPHFFLDENALPAGATAMLQAALDYLQPAEP